MTLRQKVGSNMCVCTIPSKRKGIAVNRDAVVSIEVRVRVVPQYFNFAGPASNITAQALVPIDFCYSQQCCTHTHLSFIF